MHANGYHNFMHSEDDIGSSLSGDPHTRPRSLPDLGQARTCATEVEFHYICYQQPAYPYQCREVVAEGHRGRIVYKTRQEIVLYPRVNVARGMSRALRAAS
jgi:hypothetical protein